MEVQDIKIPVLKENQFSIVEEDSYVAITYQSNDTSKENEEVLIDKMLNKCNMYAFKSFYNPYDFKTGICTSAGKWYASNKINIHKVENQELNIFAILIK